MKKIAILCVIGSSLFLSACNEADVASKNLSTAADNFEINRRIIFINGFTDKYLMTIEGKCALNVGDSRKITVTCKTDANEYKKHYLGLSDNVTYMVEQLNAVPVNVYNYRIEFRPETILPDINLRTSLDR